MHRNIAVLEEIDHVLHGLHAVGLHPVLGIATYTQGGVLAHGFIQAGREVAAAFGLHLGEHAQVCSNLGAGLVHIACTQGQEQVAGLQLVAYHMVSLGKVRQEEGIHRAILLHGVHDGLAGDAGNRQLAGGVDIGYEKFVHILQHSAEVIAQQLGARIAVRLEENHQTVRLQALGCLHCGGNFRGVVPVVVHNAVVAGKVFGFETAACAGEGGQTAGYACEISAHLQRGCGGCQGVEHVVAAGNTELHSAELFALVVDGVERAASLHGHIAGGVVGILPAVGNAVGILAAHISSAGIALAVEDSATSLAAESVEHFLDVVKVAVEVQVFGFHIQHDAVLGNVVHQRAVRFITLGDEIVAVGVPVGVGAQHGNLGAHIVAGAQACFAE